MELMLVEVEENKWVNPHRIVSVEEYPVYESTPVTRIYLDTGGFLSVWKTVPEVMKMLEGINHG